MPQQGISEHIYDKLNCDILETKSTSPEVYYNEPSNQFYSLPVDCAYKSQEHIYESLDELKQELSRIDCEQAFKRGHHRRSLHIPPQRNVHISTVSSCNASVIGSNYECSVVNQDSFTRGNSRRSLQMPQRTKSDANPRKSPSKAEKLRRRGSMIIESKITCNPLVLRCPCFVSCKLN